MNGPEPPDSKRRRAKRDTPKDSPSPMVPAPANDAGAFVFGGVYQPADFLKWGKMPFWWPPEAACVTLGFDPTSIIRATDNERANSGQNLSAFQYRLEVFIRAVAMEVFPSQIQPANAIALLDSRDETVPPELRAVVSKIRPYGPLIGLPANVFGLDDVIRGFGNSPSDILPPKLQSSW